MKFTKLCNFIFDMLPNPVNTDFPKHIGRIAKFLNDVKCGFPGLISFPELFLEFSSKRNLVGSDMVSIRVRFKLTDFLFGECFFASGIGIFLLKSLYMTAARRSNKKAVQSLGFQQFQVSIFMGTFYLCFVVQLIILKQISNKNKI